MIGNVIIEDVKIHVITLFPEMFVALTDFGITGKAFSNKKFQLEFWNPRDYTCDRRRTVDDRPYGGGPGMVMLAQPLEEACFAAKRRLGFSYAPTVLLSPQGKPLTHEKVLEFAKLSAIIFVCGRYEGVDQRFIDRCVDDEVSVGDFVVSGGELPGMLLIDAIIRQIPGTLGNEESVKQDSFFNGLLDYPHYTRPLNYKGSIVPPVLVSGNHHDIDQWRSKKSLELTASRRPDLLNISKKTNLNVPGDCLLLSNSVDGSPNGD